MVQTTVSGQTQRFIEKQSLFSENTGLPGARCVDAYYEYSGVAANTITSGISHLEGKTVQVWAWNNSDTSGTNEGEKTVSGGTFSALSASYQNIVVGMPYDANFKSAKLAYAAAAGTALNQKKRIDHLGLVLKNTHADGVRFGDNVNYLSKLSLMYRGTAINQNAMYEEFDEDSMILNGKWETDSRLFLRTSSPNPATILGAVMSLKTQDKI